MCLLDILCGMNIGYCGDTLEECSADSVVKNHRSIKNESMTGRALKIFSLEECKKMPSAVLFSGDIKAVAEKMQLTAKEISDIFPTICSVRCFIAPVLANDFFDLVGGFVRTYKAESERQEKLVILFANMFRNSRGDQKIAREDVVSQVKQSMLNFETLVSYMKTCKEILKTDAEKEMKGQISKGL